MTRWSLFLQTLSLLHHFLGLYSVNWSRIVVPTASVYPRVYGETRLYAVSGSAYMRRRTTEGMSKALRDFVNANGIEVHREYVDRAPANDLVHRTAWRDLLDDAAKKGFKTVRAFRSVKHMHDTLSAWEMVGVGFQSMRENFETTTALGRLMLNILGSLAEFKLELIRERVKAGMDRARRQGKRIGRPRVTDRRGFDRRFGAILERLSSGELSRRKAAFELGIGYATLKRLIDAQEPAG